MNTTANVANIPAWQNLSLENLEGEIWKPIEGYNGIYEISSVGRIKSSWSGKDRILIAGPNKSGSGYRIVRLFASTKKGKIFAIHQLVAMAFLGHIPCGHKLVINHKNFITTDNRVENLEIVTNRENCSFKHLKSSSKYTGVTWVKEKNKWRSEIYINKKKNHLGYFVNEIDAHQAYQNALNKINNTTTFCAWKKADREFWTLAFKN